MIVHFKCELAQHWVYCITIYTTLEALLSIMFCDSRQMLFGGWGGNMALLIVKVADPWSMY